MLLRDPLNKDENDNQNEDPEDPEESKKIQGLALRVWGIPGGIQVGESPPPQRAPTHFTPGYVMMGKRRQEGEKGIWGRLRTQLQY